MGITPAVLRGLMRYMPAKRVFSLAYPDFVMTQEQLREIAGFTTEKTSDAGVQHGIREPLPDTLEALLRLGVEEFRCVDIACLRGFEEIADLNEPHDFGKFDLVMDCGTTEHCANIWQATLNAANAVAVGGVVFHQVPITMVNHGFFNVNPTFYADLYGQNGWEIEQLYITDGRDSLSIDPFARVNVTSELSLCAAARRHTGEAIKAPTQHKYLRMLSK